jgi:outer membrane murein-binding lipoprotein Lpp
MPAAARISKIKQTETDIAVLQVQVNNLNDKVDELKSDIKELRGAMERGSEDTTSLIKELQTSNQESHDRLAEKISILERMRWMLLGAAAVGGAMGFEAFQSVIANFVQ